MLDIKTEDEISEMRKSAIIVSKVLENIEAKIIPGVSTQELDEYAYRTIISLDGTPAFLGYRNYPATICASINNELVHGIPAKNKILKEGDIVSIDLGVKYKGFYGDMARTFPVGKISLRAHNLMQVAYNVFNEALKYVSINNRVGDISSAIQSYVEKNGFSVIRDYVGHGIGRALHEKPEIPNFGQADSGPKLTKGMVICLEPMVAEGGWEVKTMSDGWTVVTRDGKLCVHYEHMVAVTENGPEVLTK